MDFTFLDNIIAILKDLVAKLTKFIDGFRNKEIVFDKEVAENAGV